FFSSRRRHTRWPRDWSSDVCSSDLAERRFTFRVEDDHLYIGGKPFRLFREKWADIAAIDIDERYGTIRTRAGRTRRLDLADLEEIGRASCRERGEVAVVAV